METIQVEHPWEQQEHDEFEEGLIARRKNLNQTPVSTAINGDFSSNNGGSVGLTNGEDQEQDEKEEEEEEEKVKDFSQQNGIKVDEDEKEKEKQQTSEYIVYYDADKAIFFRFKGYFLFWVETNIFFYILFSCELFLRYYYVKSWIKNSRLWKCRICSWDCEGRTCLPHHNQNPKLLNAKTIDQKRLCFFHETEGTEFHHESSEVEANGVDSTFHGKIPMKGNNDITNHNEENGNSISDQNVEHQKQNNLSDSSLQPSEISFEEVDKTEISEIEVIKDVENEYDVETVIKRQETHDLFCPNCNSCITKRVILRKRKRKIPVPSEITKRNKPETSNSSEVNLVSDEVISNEYDHEREPDVFRCLSCFSIFMPTGDGFKFFRMFGNKNNQENSQSSQKDVAVKKSWFANIFASNKVEQSNNQGLSRPEVNPRTTNVSMDLAKDQVQSAIPNVNQQQLQYPNTTGYGVNRRLDVDSLAPSVNGDKNTPSLSQASNTIKQPISEESDKVVRESNGSYRPKANSSHTTNGNMDMEKNQGQSATPSVNGGENAAQGLNIIKQPIAHESDEAVRDSTGMITTDSQSAESPDHLVTSYHTEFNTQSDYPGMFVVKPPLNNTEPEQDLISPHHHDGLTLHVPPNVGSLIIDNSKMNQLLDVTIQTNTPDLEIGSRAVEQGGGGGTVVAGGRGLDIVKSIVYGGLLEIIASLSVVASAVGADAATLNVLALGLANIFGGLIVISHDLWDLKNEVAREEDRYQQLLGRRADFPLHMLVSLLSYLVFGFLPPVIYGFSFRESNDRDFKLLMVAAASTVCIMILAAGKAYVQCPRKSYIKTISYYIVFGLAVSGVSYFFGELIMKLLEKIDIFPSGQAVNLSFHGAGTNPALIATY
ncbi:hypothetical protein L1887_28339 [Cichorium endivia]|nr:hypothetical protein L1887_28339 [Cichorium endivia]